MLAKYPSSFGRREDGTQSVFVGDEDVTLAIRQNDVTNNVSWVAAIPEVRTELVIQRRRIAEKGAIIMDDRDIGTVVIPNAERKIILVASGDERAERRDKENQEKGIETNHERIKEESAARDCKDSHRKVTPLKAAEDVITLDTSGIPIEDVVQFIQEKAQKKIDSLTQSCYNANNKKSRSESYSPCDYRCQALQVRFQSRNITRSADLCWQVR